MKVDSTGVVKAYGDLNKFAEEALNASGKASKLKNSMSDLDDVFNIFNPRILAQTAGITALVGAYTKLMGAVIGFGKDSIKTYSSFESIKTGLQTALQSAEKGEQAFEQLRRFSNETTFGVDELASATTQLMNVGVSMNEMETVLRRIGDVSGGSKEKFAELVSIYSKIQSTGKAGAMQLQQLALRGVPVYQVLKDIGVQGVATGEDIAEVFKRLTDEGGQFHGAMENILDTIEGKEGEVSDFWKEFTVGFAEATGLADMYKTALSGLRNGLEWLANLMQKINKNPVYKALFTGALVATITALTVVVGVALWGAVKRLNSELAVTATLKAMIDWKQALIGLGVATAVGATIGIASYNMRKDAEEAKDAMYELEDGTKVLCKSMDELEERIDEGIFVSYADQLRVQAFKLKKAKDELERAQTSEVRLTYVVENKTLGIDVRAYQGLGELLKKEQERQVEAKKQIEYYNIEIERLSEQARIMDIINKYEREYVEMMKQAVEYDEDILKSASALAEKSKEKQLLKNLELIKKYNTMLAEGTKTVYAVETHGSYTKNVGTVEQKLTADEIKDLQLALQELNKAISSAYHAKDWEKLLESMLDEKANGRGDTRYIDDYLKKEKQKLEKILTFKDNTAVLSYWEAFADKGVDIINNVIGSGLFTDDSTDKTTDAFKKKMGDILKRSLNGFQEAPEARGTEKYKQYLEKLLETTKTLRQLQGDLSSEDEETRALVEAEYIENVKQELELARLTTDELEKQRLLKLGMSVENAEEVVRLNRLKSSATNVASARDAYANANSFSERVNTNTALAQSKYLDAMNKLRYALNSDEETQRIATEELKVATKEYTEALSEQKLIDTVTGFMSGTDAGDFAKGAQDGGVWVGLLNMFFGALSRALGSIEGISYALSPITTALKEFAPIIKVILIICMMLTPLIKGLAQVIMWLLDTLTFGLFSNASQAYDEMIDEIEGTSETMRDLTQDMKNLSDAIAEQYEYYLKKKTELMATTYTEGVGLHSTSVNDMILTPNGNFSTHPDDYIIATKNPSGLNGGNNVVQMKPIINNYASSDTSANVTTRQNGNITELLVTISKKIASDVADGSNGWDNAMTARESRISGRRVSL